MNGALFKLFAHEFLFTEPRILLLALLIDVGWPSIGRGWRLILALGVSCFGVGSSHIKHNVVEIIIQILIFLLVIIIIASGLRWIFKLDINDLVLLQLHVLFNEVKNCLAETDLVVETGGPDQRGRLCAISLCQLYRFQVLLFFLALSVVELSDLDLLDVLVARVLQDDQLMSNDSIRYLLLLRRVQLVSVGYLMDLHLASVMHLSVLIEDLSNVHFFLAASILVVRPHGPGQRHLHLGRLLVHMAIAHLGDVIEDIAPLAPEYLKVRPHLPVDLSP